jgi:protein-S-isoprenylcysteine O-methyltransferase Ste14
MSARLFLRTFVWFAFLAALLFGPAGTARWPAGWAFLLELGACSLALAFWLARHDPALFAARSAPLIQRDQKPWDKILMTCFMVVFCAWLVFMALDAERFRWSSVPPSVRALGAFGILLSFFFIFLTFRANSFAAPVVKIQTSRGHTVVTTGPYRFVRHPMYGGVLFLFLGTPLLLGSWWGLALALFPVVLLAVRAVLEERTLAAELPGYAEYAAGVRYRLIPFVW